MSRGKRNITGEWVEGFYVHQGAEISDDRIDNHFILVHDHLGFNWYQIDPKTAARYTGLTDKNGKKIFEWDIVRVSWHSTSNVVSEVYVVVYSKSGFFCRARGRLLGQLSNYVHRNALTVQCEVIGNVEDNPELLGQEWSK